MSSVVPLVCKLYFGIWVFDPMQSANVQEYMCPSAHVWLRLHLFDFACQTLLQPLSINQTLKGPALTD